MNTYRIYRVNLRSKSSIFQKVLGQTGNQTRSPQHGLAAKPTRLTLRHIRLQHAKFVINLILYFSIGHISINFPRVILPNS